MKLDACTFLPLAIVLAYASIPGAPAAAQMTCSIEAECEASRVGWCACTETRKVWRDGIEKQCHGSGDQVLGRRACGELDTLAAAVIDPRGTAQDAGRIEPDVVASLRAESALAALMLEALSDEGRLVEGTGAGVVRISRNDEPAPRVYRYAFTTAVKTHEGAGFTLSYGTIDGPLSSSLSGQTAADGHAGSMRISDAEGIRTLTWDLNQYEPFRWSR